MNLARKYIIQVINAFGYSMLGLKAALKEQLAFQLELGIFIIAIPVAIFISRDVIDFILLLGSILLVMLVEVLNSAIETTVDRISREKHELSGRAKDMGSAAVFIAVCITVLVWGGIVYKNFF